MRRSGPAALSLACLALAVVLAVREERRGPVVPPPVTSLPPAAGGLVGSAEPGVVLWIESVARERGRTVITAFRQENTTREALRVVLEKRSATIESAGPGSDALLRDMDDVWLAKVKPSVMRVSTRFMAAPLAGDPEKLEAGVKLKLSFESKPDERYGEAVLAISLEPATSRALLLGAETPEYRRALVNALTLR